MANHNDAARPDAAKINLGIAGGLAKAFINSPLTPMLLAACLLVGAIGLYFTPRQEDPQISVPMFDVFVEFPGASATQVANSAISPLERVLSDIEGVKHVYSVSEKGRGMVTVQFKVGENEEVSRTKLKTKIDANMHLRPPGVTRMMVKNKGVDSVPVVALTLWSETMDDAFLRKMAKEVEKELKVVPNTSESFVTGGRRDQLRVEIYPEKLSGYGISLAQIVQAIQERNQKQNIGKVEAGGKFISVETGDFISSARDLENLQISSRGGSPVYLRDIAKIIAGPGETGNIVSYHTGPAARMEGLKPTDGAAAVTIAIAKKKGSNGIDVAQGVLDHVKKLKERQVISDQVNVAVTRNYGETAKNKVNTLIMKLFIATTIVVVLIWAALNFMWQPAVVVAIVIPIVILFTVFSALIMGYTIDRVSLFALIFSIGILVDDAIVVVENIYRNWLIHDSTDDEITINAVAEVGNPTILATFTVIAALLPMGFVSGMMGPYMAPIPALGSVAMLFSVIAAFVFTPWLVVRIKPSKEQLEKMEFKEHKQMTMLTRLFQKTLGPLLDSPYKARLFRMTIWAVFLVSCSLFYFKAVTVKMMPLDNKPEFNVVINMKDGTALPVTANAAQRMTEVILQVPEVTAVQVYAGTSSPFNFNGLVRHYYLRNRPWQADIQVQLLGKKHRKRTSHQIAEDVRNRLQKVSKETNADIQVVEMPPGPPVLQTMVAEIYGPDDATRRQVARDMTEIFKKAPSVIDVDNYLTDPHMVWEFVPNIRKAQAEGLTTKDLTAQMAMMMGGFKVGDAKGGHELEARYIVVQAPLEIRSDVSRLLQLPIMTKSGRMIPLGELGTFKQIPAEQAIFHKDLRSVEYVTGEVTGKYAAPVYGQVEVGKLLANYTTPDGVKLTGSWLGLPSDTNSSSFEWGGEWTVTFETFRDMGLAFMAAMVFIYALVVWEFGNFRLPSIIMAPIPLTLIGIIPFHGILGKEFTATSMIGWIALAGIIVRNSILLVDFAKHEILAGVEKREAVMNAVVARTRPIMVTALALVGGSFVIYSDPIFNGMAISLMAGVMVSTVLTLYVIPMAAAVAHGAYGEELPEVSAEEAGAETAKAAEKQADKEAEPSLAARLVGMVSGLLMMAWGGFKWIWGAPVSTGNALKEKATASEASPVARLMSFLAMGYFILRSLMMAIIMLFKWIWGGPPPKSPASAGMPKGDNNPSSGTPQNVRDAVTRLNEAVSGKTETANKDNTAGEAKTASLATNKTEASEKSDAEGEKPASGTSAEDKPDQNPKPDEGLPAVAKQMKASPAKRSSVVEKKDGEAPKASSSLSAEKAKKEEADKTSKTPDISQKSAVSKTTGTTSQPDSPKTTDKAVSENDNQKSAVKDEDIRLIRGIGPSMEVSLKKFGFASLRKIADMTPEQIEKVESDIGFKGRILRENWIEQARDLLETGEVRPASQPQRPDQGIETKESGERSADPARIAADDITLIKGIGPSTAKKLAGIGIDTLEKIANLEEEDYARIDTVITFKGSAKREHWREQASELLKRN